MKTKKELLFNELKDDIETFFNTASEEEILTLIDSFIEKYPETIVLPDKEIEVFIDELIKDMEIY